MQGVMFAPPAAASSILLCGLCYFYHQGKMYEPKVAKRCIHGQ